MSAKLWSLLAILLFYIVGVIAMLYGSNRQKRREIARDQIINYLTTKNLKMISLDGIRSYIDNNYSDTFLKTLIKEYPNDLRRAILKGGREGIGIIVEEQ